MRAVLKALTVAVLTVVGAVALPAAAEAQARGTLQATATVVDTKQSFGALDAARQAVQSGTASKIGNVETVATVAQISVARSANRPGSLVVTIDFSRN
jgi:hypothetical protein